MRLQYSDPAALGCQTMIIKANILLFFILYNVITLASGCNRCGLDSHTWCVTRCRQYVLLMPIRFQTSNRLSSLPSLINTNYWMPSRMMMTSNGKQREPWDARWDHCHDRILRFTMAQGVFAERLSKSYVHRFGPCRTHGHRNRLSEVGGATQPPSTFHWKANSHPHADTKTAGASPPQVNCDSVWTCDRRSPVQRCDKRTGLFQALQWNPHALVSSTTQQGIIKLL